MDSGNGRVGVKVCDLGVDSGAVESGVKSVQIDGL